MQSMYILNNIFGEKIQLPDPGNILYEVSRKKIGMIFLSSSKLYISLDNNGEKPASPTSLTFLQEIYL